MVFNGQWFCPRFCIKKSWHVQKWKQGPFHFIHFTHMCWSRKRTLWALKLYGSIDVFWLQKGEQLAAKPSCLFKHLKRPTLEKHFNILRHHHIWKTEGGPRFQLHVWKIRIGLHHVGGTSPAKISDIERSQIKIWSLQLGRTSLDWPGTIFCTCLYVSGDACIACLQSFLNVPAMEDAIFEFASTVNSHCCL